MNDAVDGQPNIDSVDSGQNSFSHKNEHIQTVDRGEDVLKSDVESYSHHMISPLQLSDTEGLDEGARLSKFLSRAGVCSRRDAERFIEEGRVRLNGELVTSPVTFVKNGDEVLFDDEPVHSPEDLRVWMYYKPVGLVTTHKDPEDRHTVFDALPYDMPRVISVGRLDLNSEGLLLLTNSGAFSRFAEHPTTGWKRTYKVRVFGDVDERELNNLNQGITIEGIHYKSIDVVVSRQSGRNAWLLITLTEGKNREIRRVLNHLGLQVNRLIRISYGPFELGNMEVEEVKECSQKLLSKIYQSNDEADLF